MIKPYKTHIVILSPIFVLRSLKVFLGNKFDILVNVELRLIQKLK